MENSTYVCQLTGRSGTAQNMIPARAVNSKLIHLIKSKGHQWDKNGYVDAEAINQLLLSEPGVDAEHLIGFSADELEESYQSNLTFGERLSDKIAEFGGSWKFILSFLAMIVCWITINSFALMNTHFDPFPFILLNLVLSCIAAIQAPIIMMSQNRQEAKDRLRAKNDYNINLKAEQEIRMLHKKIEELIEVHKHTNR
jgi:uncharacterized membrane protein